MGAGHYNIKTDLLGTDYCPLNEFEELLLVKQITVLSRLSRRKVAV